MNNLGILKIEDVEKLIKLADDRLSALKALLNETDDFSSFEFRICVSDASTPMSVLLEMAEEM